MRIPVRRASVPAAAVLALAAAASATAPAGSKAYVVNTEGNSVTVVALDSFGAPGGTKTIPLGNLPQGAALDTIHGRLFVANSDDDAVAVIDTATDALLDVDGTPGQDPPIQLTGFNPTGLAVSPDGSTVYAACQSPGVCVISGSPLAETSKITLPKLGTPSPIATAVVVHPAGGKIYVVDSGQDVAWPVTVPSNVVGTAIPIHSGGQGRGPSGAAIYQGGNRMIVVGDGPPVLIDTTTDTEIATSWTRIGAQIAVAVAGNRAVVADVYNTVVSGGSVDVYDLSNTSAPPVSFIAGGLVNGVSIAPDGSLAWASCHRFGGHGGVAGSAAGVLVQFDPADVTATILKAPIGTGSDGAGPVVGLFTGAGPPPTGNVVEAFVLPARADLLLKGAGRDSLFLVGAFDDGGAAVDWTMPVTFEAGPLARTVTLSPNGSGTVWKARDGTFSLTLKPDLGGSSRGTFTARFSKATLGGVVAPDATLPLHLRAAGLSGAAGTVTLEGGAYVAGNVRGELVAPGAFVSAVGVKTSDTKPDVLALTAGFRTSGAAPAALGTVRIGVGPQFSVVLQPSDLTRSGDVFRHSSKDAVSSLTVLLDFGHGTVTVKAKGHETGALAGPATDVTLDAGDGVGARTVRVSLGSAGTKRAY